MPKKIRELKSILQQAGFTLIKKRGKGSHSRWFHPVLPEDRVTLCGKDGDDAPLYLEKQVQQTLEKLAQITEEESE
jgi:predicted RNA binding protein YcfA (HicA-like mRNA interferase family)